uniref:Uncharacterized protein n=1 Tax=Anguilla anguilla TaxID=7936 RepID=A0A0E9TRK1_ANGAN
MNSILFVLSSLSNIMCWGRYYLMYFIIFDCFQF